MVQRLFIALFIFILAGICAASKTASPSEDCMQEPDPGICRGMFKKWFYNATSYRCEVFYYGGCNGNGNRFNKFAECSKKCRDPVLGVCALPEPKQICRAGYKGYRFNPFKQRCVRYIYCEHNENHFPTEEECQAQCGKFAQDSCLLPKHVGRNCSRSSRMQNFWFNSKTKVCEQFDYEGCGGNGNNFLYESECWKTCGKYVESNCSYPIHRGRECPNGSPKVAFGYNNKNKRCERFVYYGCGGYPNRFDSARECWNTCGRDSGSKCVEPGPKNRFGLVKKYYYDLESDSCKTSRYSPFSSKKNRFNTKDDCEGTCKANYTSSIASF
ncbi:tissue factor pathway inhibitor 2-like [Amblyomma americanum]